MIVLKMGRMGEGMSYSLPRRNETPWVSIAKFLEKDPLIALGLQGGWAVRQSVAVTEAPAPARSEARTGAGASVFAQAPVSIIPLGNHGDNNL